MSKMKRWHVAMHHKPCFPSAPLVTHPFVATCCYIPLSRMPGIGVPLKKLCGKGVVFTASRAFLVQTTSQNPPACYTPNYMDLQQHQQQNHRYFLHQCHIHEQNRPKVTKVSMADSLRFPYYIQRISRHSRHEAEDLVPAPDSPRLQGPSAMRRRGRRQICNRGRRWGWHFLRGKYVQMSACE